MIRKEIISIPNIKTQKNISSILSSLDDKIELNNRINKNLEEQAQALFKSSFVDFEFPNENGQPYKSSGGAMISSTLGEIPEGWTVGRLSDIAIITSGKRPNNKSNKQSENIKYPIIGASSVM